MSKVFISYRRQDAGAEAFLIAEYFRERYGERNVFIDVDNIPRGVDFVEAIQREVGSSDVLLAVIGKAWSTITDASGTRRLDDEKDYVRLEIAAALQRNIRVVPLFVQGASMPSAKDLPPNISQLATRNGIDIHQTSFRGDIALLTKGLETGRFAIKRPVFRARWAWISICGILLLSTALVVKTFGPHLKSTADPTSFKVKPKIRLNSDFGSSDPVPEMKLMHRKPKERGTSLLDHPVQIDAEEFEYEAYIPLMPAVGQRYFGYLHREVQAGVKTTPKPTKVCFGRKTDSLAQEPIIRLACNEGEICQIARDDFGWASPCDDTKTRNLIPSLMAPVYAQSDPEALAPGWVVPALQTLLNQERTKRNPAFTQFRLRSEPIPALKGATRVSYSIRVNGTAVYIDGLPPESVTFSPSAGLRVEFGLENLDFSGEHGGYEYIELLLSFSSDSGLVRRIPISLQYVALRSAPESIVTSTNFTSVKWQAVYHPGNREDVYQIFLLSTLRPDGAEQLKQRIDKAGLHIAGEPMVAVVRPPLDDNRSFGVVVGVRQRSGQVKFTFNDEISRLYCHEITHVATVSPLIESTTFRRSVASKGVSGACAAF